MINQLLTASTLASDIQFSQGVPVASCWGEGVVLLSPGQDVASQDLWTGPGLFTFLAAWLIVKMGEVQGSTQV